MSGNDDGGAGLFSLLDYNLLVGTEYYMVVTGFSNSSYGPYTATITGRGDITIIPEPATFLLFGAGLLGLWLLRRR